MTPLHLNVSVLPGERAFIRLKAPSPNLSVLLGKKTLGIGLGGVAVGSRFPVTGLAHLPNRTCAVADDQIAASPSADLRVPGLASSERRSRPHGHGSVRLLP